MYDLFGLRIINEENINDYVVPGVWALFGKRINTQDSRWYCLQVGETKCIKSEIEKDSQLIKEELNEKGAEISYVNQFGESLFSYFVYPSSREYLYSKYIKEQFKDLCFVYICEEQDRIRRRNIEKEFAYRTNAVYWRNGGPFQKGKEIDYDKRECAKGEVPDNGEITKQVITPFITKYTNQTKNNY